MLVGLTYDLRDEYLKEGYSHEETAEFDKEETIIGIESTLQLLGYNTDRIGHVRNLSKRLASGDRWEIVFNIAEGMYGIAREAQVPALLDAFQIPYVFSDGLVLALCLHKGLTKRIIRDAGFNTPDFFIVENSNDIKKINLAYPLFAKPVAEGTGKGISGLSKILNYEQLEKISLGLLSKFNQPVLVERFLPGREFTVGIIGTANDAIAAGIMEVIFLENEKTKIYSLENKENYYDIIKYAVPEKEISEKCYELALNCWKILGCRDGGRIDIRLDDNNEPSFIEVNPLAGLNYIHSDLPILCNFQGIDFKQLIEMIMNSALKRIKK
jgi:D-alanine-D-alanine ligase